jgi:hypothetical protein
MIKSKYISDILDLLLDGDDLGQKARFQIDFLTETNYTYTGIGVFVKFSHDDGIEQYTLKTDHTVINGVEIKSTELDIGAEAMVFISNGLIDYLEIWSYNGEYPARELTSYTLTQGWANAPGREIKVN